VTLALQVAAADVPVLITGENGSGKERVADLIQANSLRRKMPFGGTGLGPGLGRRDHRRPRRQCETSASSVVRCRLIALRALSELMG
jgi:hypothetical protein